MKAGWPSAELVAQHQHGCLDPAKQFADAGGRLQKIDDQIGFGPGDRLVDQMVCKVRRSSGSRLSASSTESVSEMPRSALKWKPGLNVLCNGTPKAFWTYSGGGRLPLVQRWRNHDFVASVQQHLPHGEEAWVKWPRPSPWMTNRIFVCRSQAARPGRLSSHNRLALVQQIEPMPPNVRKPTHLKFVDSLFDLSGIRA